MVSLFSGGIKHDEIVCAISIIIIIAIILSLSEFLY